MKLQQILTKSALLLVFISLFSCSDDTYIIDPIPGTEPGTFSASINNQPFTANADSIYAYTTTIEYDFNNEDNSVSESGTYEAIRIIGAGDTQSIALILPVNSVTGTYYISDTEGYYLANYSTYPANTTGVGTGGAEDPTTNDTTPTTPINTEVNTTRAYQGVISVTLHNTQYNYIEGTFSFNTNDDDTVSSGTFKTYYTEN